ncbi:hypothetical protein MUK42_21146 [Musa troglodytarum]|uniref:C2H2-type domain-containing protein n=2 Tax=Musa troglodytarum TaxID=320322 RepID=A0A9E7G263_9LILI|nr:hypothetical protein MUK42_21146 [Musa troglodytarum]
MASCFFSPFSSCGLLLLFFFSFSVFWFYYGDSHPVFDPHWHPATATWYGSPDGDGSDGGACGYGSLVDVRPLRARVGAVSPVLFKGGQGCGACYKVRCLDPAICSRRAVTVIVTDECPGGYCASGRTHFDLSGAAFGRLAVAGEAGQIRDRGEISVVFRRYSPECLTVLSAWIAANSVEWLEMKHIWGGNWCFNGGPLQGPFSVKLATLTTQKTFTARDVIPSPTLNFGIFVAKEADWSSNLKELEMLGRELVLRKEAAVNLREVAARTTLREVRQKGHIYVELRHVGKRIIFFCTLCLTPCYSDTVLFDHLRGNLHARRLTAAKATLFGATPWPFNDGVLFFDSSNEPDLLLSGSDSQNDMALVVSNSSGTDHEVTSSFTLDSPSRNCCGRKRSGNYSKSDGSSDAKLGSSSNGHKASLRSSCTALDMVSTCSWAENSLIIPGVLLKEEVSNLALKHLGVGQIAYRIQEDKEGHGRKGAVEEEEPLTSPGSFFEIDDSGHRRQRKRKSFSDQEDYSDGSNGCSESLSGDGSSLDIVAADDPQQLEKRLISSKVVWRQLRKQKRLAAERICDICGQPMLPGKDVASLLNCRTGNLACSSRNTNGYVMQAFHPFHASCLIHWILLCESEMADQRNKTKVTRGRKGRSMLKNRISSIFCPECQGTGVAIKGEELEKPTIPLSEMFLYKLKAIEANKAWMKNPEILQKCSTGLHFPSGCVDNSQENVMPLKLLHFFRADQ